MTQGLEGLVATTGRPLEGVPNGGVAACDAVLEAEGDGLGVGMPEHEPRRLTERDLPVPKHGSVKIAFVAWIEQELFPTQSPATTPALEAALQELAVKPPPQPPVGVPYDAN